MHATRFHGLASAWALRTKSDPWLVYGSTCTINLLVRWVYLQLGLGAWCMTSHELPSRTTRPKKDGHGHSFGGVV